MTQTAKIINFERPVVKADIENGFTRIANELTEALMQNAAKLNGREFQIVHAVIHKTFRFHKKSDWISNAQISEMTGIAQSKISAVKKSLIAKNVLVQIGRELSVNTTVSEWQNYPKKGKEDFTPNGVTAYPNSGNDLPKKGYKITPNRGTHKKTTNTKDNYTKDNSRVAAPKLTKSAKQSKPDIQSEILSLQIPSGLSFDMWKEWVESRAENKKPMTVRSAKMQIKQLSQWQAKGHDLDAIVQTSIANNYQGLFEPKTSANGGMSWNARKTQNNVDVLSNFVAEADHD